MRPLKLTKTKPKQTLWPGVFLFNVSFSHQTWWDCWAHIVGVAEIFFTRTDVVLDKIYTSAKVNSLCQVLLFLKMHKMIMISKPGSTWVDHHVPVPAHGDGGRHRCRRDHQYTRPSGQTLKLSLLDCKSIINCHTEGTKIRQSNWSLLSALVCWMAASCHVLQKQRFKYRHRSLSLTGRSDRRDRGSRRRSGESCCSSRPGSRPRKTQCTWSATFECLREPVKFYFTDLVCKG